MRTRLLVFLWFTFCWFASQAQNTNYNTFSNFYQGYYIHDIVELKDSSLLFYNERSTSLTTPGMQLRRISKSGELLDSMSMFVGKYPRIYEFHHGAFAFLNDSIAISGFSAIGSSNLPPNHLEVILIKVKALPHLDTIKTQILTVSFPDSFYTWNQWRDYRPRAIIKSKNGNVLLAGELIGNEGFGMPYFTEVDEDLNVVNSFYLFDSIFGYRIHGFQELNDGTFIISGQVFQYGSLFQQLRNSTRAFIARIDTSGQFIWRNIIPSGAPSNRNFYANDRPASFDMSADSTLGLAYFQHLACPDSTRPNPCVFSNAIIGRYRFISYDLNGNILSSSNITSENVLALVFSGMSAYQIKAISNNKGYIFSGNYINRGINVTAGFVSRLSQTGDSIWWREPRLRHSNPFEDYNSIFLTRETSDGGFVGVGIYHILESLTTIHRTRGFVFKLDSNGCYEPGICPNSML
ncbi:MAG: hypothetical protein EA358_00085, partial [Flavobacteriales bacterium]